MCKAIYFVATLLYAYVWLMPNYLLPDVVVNALTHTSVYVCVCVRAPLVIHTDALFDAHRMLLPAVARIYVHTQTHIELFVCALFTHTHLHL